MSIIYDALKRVSPQVKDSNQLESRPEGSPKPKHNRKLQQLIYVLVAFVFFVLLALFVDRPSSEKSFIDQSYNVDKKPHSSPLKKKVASSVKLISSSKNNAAVLFKKLPAFYITGIFFSDGKYIALINDKVIQAGDIIEETEVQRIDAGGVEIKFKDSTFRLNYP